ncbi:YjgP/YjgQ family permease [candidate division KSB1 bacterium]|nr:MAG: YjgP/YjgQ family permease [candidate division KSB1 bacterium]
MTYFRYIFREFFPPFIFSLSLIIFLFVMNLLFQMLGKIAGKGLPLGTIAEYFFLNLAWMVAMAVPMAVLVGTLTAYGRLSADGEITALKSSGAGQWRLMAPAVMIAGTVAVLVVMFNVRLLPQMNHRSRQLQADIRRKKPTMVLEPGVFLSDIPGYVLIAREVNQQTSEMRDVVVYQETDPDYATTITAKHGLLRYEESIESFEFLMREGQIDRASRRKISEFQTTAFGRAIFRISAPEMSLRRTESSWRSERELTTVQLVERLRSIKKTPKPNRKEINSIEVEIHKKFSIPAACLVFGILGSVLGQWVKRSGLGVSAGYSIFFFLIYWVFLISGEDFADRGRVVPWLAMWLPNFIFLVLGIGLIWRERKGQMVLPIDRIRAALARRRGEETKET